MLTVLNNGSHTMTLDQGNRQKTLRDLPVLPSLLCTGAQQTWWASAWCPVLQCRDSLSLCASSWHAVGFAAGLAAAALVAQLGGGDAGKPLALTVRLYPHSGPDPGPALSTPFVCLLRELLSLFPWRKDTSSELAESENLTHTRLLWLWYPARGKGQSPAVMVQWAELIEGKDVHPAFSWTRSLSYSLQIKLCKVPPTKHFPR